MNNPCLLSLWLLLEVSFQLSVLVVFDHELSRKRVGGCLLSRSSRPAFQQPTFPIIREISFVLQSCELPFFGQHWWRFDGTGWRSSPSTIPLALPRLLRHIFRPIFFKYLGQRQPKANEAPEQQRNISMVKTTITLVFWIC